MHERILPNLEHNIVNDECDKTNYKKGKAAGLDEIPPEE